MREKISLRTGVKELKRFVPGGTSAFNFVTSCQLPIELAGEKNSGVKNGLETVHGSIQLKELADFQLDVHDQTVEFFKSVGQDANKLLTLPTGAGKTRTAIQSIHTWIENSYGMENSYEKCNLTVWVAQKDELCEQALSSLLNCGNANPIPLKLSLLDSGEDTGTTCKKKYWLQ
ncbi:MAG: DEAD/DEAH box helicase family protein [Bdellovibrionota bacterium]